MAYTCITSSIGAIVFRITTFFSRSTSNLAFGSEPTELAISLSSAFIATSWYLGFETQGKLIWKHYCYVQYFAHIQILSPSIYYPIQTNTAKQSIPKHMGLMLIIVIIIMSNSLSLLMFRLLSKIAQPLIIIS